MESRIPDWWDLAFGILKHYDSYEISASEENVLNAFDIYVVKLCEAGSRQSNFPGEAGKRRENFLHMNRSLDSLQRPLDIAMSDPVKIKNNKIQT